MTETVARSPKERELAEEQIDTGTGIMRAVVGITVGGTELYRISLCVSPTTTGLE